jgi:hypothetical protein
LPRAIGREVIERRALAGLTEKLVSPAAVADAVRAHHQGTNRRNHERRAQAEGDRRDLEKIALAIKGIIAAIEDGHVSARYEGAHERAGAAESRLTATRTRIESRYLCQAALSALAARNNARISSARRVARVLHGTLGNPWKRLGNPGSSAAAPCNTFSRRGGSPEAREPLSIGFSKWLGE